MPEAKLPLLVKSVTYETPEVRLYDLRLPNGGDLPRFTAGAHIDLDLASGLRRSYSITNGEDDRDRYLIGVARDANSRGGSSYIHKALMPGDLIEVSQPKNNFPLDESQDDTVLIAGGIGITPIMSMLRRLHALGRRWKLYFAARSRGMMPFRGDLRPFADHLALHFDDENGGVLNIDQIVNSHENTAHFYCCGPNPMLDAFERAVSRIPPERVHLERFSSVEEAATEGGFHVELAKSGKTLFVDRGKTILDALLDAGVEAPFSCQSGVCGTCETKVISGLPDHRDLFLDDSEHQSNRSMMICCSGSKSAKLVLDL